MLEKFFGKFLKQDELPAEWRTPRYFQTRYDPSLVMALTHQHRTLNLLLVEASSAAQLGAYDEAGSVLEQFEFALEDHLKQERDRLHPYLAEHIKGGDGEETLKDMYACSALAQRSVATFLDRYRDKPVDASSLAQFEHDIETVSEKLSQDMEREEAMFYTLYLPPEAY
ncbi:MAG TPA: hemerythrin domain-containing protein [Gammaproteobacteria bacterium]|nr:hemerythrin domain-containing protein [Gammaproteobacteria bacterium]